ncbi:MAG: hypothetical protein GX774_09140 [Armatimonadetes bacterium]|nr:hypothetical protein [Armatimonadota bacterium]
MKRRYRFGILVLGAAVLGGATTARALSGTIADAVKVMGIGFAVKTFGPQINSAINTVLMQNNIERHGATKVVPVLSVGQGAYIGAAQVTGPQEDVSKIQAVVQGEMNVGGEVRLKGLVPVDSLNPFESLPKPKFNGVGVTALIDFHV